MLNFSLWRSGGSKSQRRRLTWGRRADAIETLEIRLLPAATTIGTVFDGPSRIVGDQNYDAIAAGPDGSFTFVFADASLDSSGWGVYARRFSANGTPLGNQFRLNSTVANDQYFPSISTNSDGESLVVWHNERFAGGYTYPISLDLQLINADGTLLGGNVNLIPEDYYEVDDGHYFDATSWDYATKPLTFVDSSDQFWVAVPISRNGNDGYGKMYQFWTVSTTGEVSKAFQTSLPDEMGSTSLNVPIPVDIQLGDDGTFYVTYGVEQTQAIPDVGQQYTSQLFVRRISSATGQQLGSDIVVDSVTYYDDYSAQQGKPLLVPESSGKFSVVYYNKTGDLVTQHFNANGSKLGSLVELIDHTELNSGYYQEQVSVEVLSNGNWLVAWSVGVAFDIDTAYIREFQADGTADGHAAVLGEAYYFGAIHIAAQGNDQFVVSWQDGGGSAGYGAVYGRRVAANVAVPGVTVTPLTELQTSEDGDTATFQIVLDAAPTQDVLIPLSVTDNTAASLSASQLIFTSANWNVPQTVTITGLNNYVAYGDSYYDFELGPTFSLDSNYSNVAVPSLSLVNLDNDVVGITVTPTGGLTVSESGSTSNFSVVLNTQPYANVSVSVTSSDTTEGTVNKSSLVFTPGNWNVAQVVTITGVNDNLTDGDIAFQVILGSTVSADYDYDGLFTPDVSVANLDNDVPGISVTGGTTLATTESGASSSFQVVLQTQPSAQVTINLQSDNTSEGTLNKSTLTFTTANWNVPQVVTLTGQNDDVDDGDVTYHVVFTSVSSSDANYNNRSLSNLTAQNADNDTAGFTVTPTSGLQTSETGGTATFTVKLNSKPASDVTIAVASSNTGEGTPSVSQLVFTSSNWNVAQTVTVTGVNDEVFDSAVAYQIVLGTATSSDQNYSGLDPQDVSLVNRALNLAPTLELSGAAPTFGKKSSPVSVNSTAVVTDDAPHFAGGRLRISISSGFDVSDALTLSTTIGGLSLGTLTRSGANYIVDLNANATPAALQQLLQSVKFSTAKKGQRVPSRLIEFQLTDSDGAVSNTVTRTVQVSKKKLK